MSAIDVEMKYERWWRNKYCRLAGSHGKFKLVYDVELDGPPSGIYGSARLVYSDSEKQFVPHGSASKPRKMDVEVWPHEGKPPDIEKF